MKKYLLTLILFFAVGAGLKAQGYKFNVTYTNTVQYEYEGNTALTGAINNVNLDSTYYEVMNVDWVHNEYTATSNGYYCSTQTSGMQENYNPLLFTPFNDSGKYIYIRVIGANSYDETLYLHPYSGTTFEIPKGDFDIYVFEENME